MKSLLIAIIENPLLTGISSAAIATYFTFKLMERKEKLQLQNLEIMYYAELEDLKERYFYQLKCVINEYNDPFIDSVSLPFTVDFDYLFKLQMNLIPKLGESHRDLYRQLKVSIFIMDTLYRERDIKTNNTIHLDRYNSARLIVETSTVIYKLLMAIDQKDKLQIQKNHSYLEIIEIACIAIGLDFDKQFFEKILKFTEQTED